MCADSLIKSQKEVAEKLERLLTNFKKDSPARKTADYLDSKQKELELLWKNFTDLHDQIIQLLEANHSYFTEDIYARTKKIYLDACNKINACRANNLAQPEMPPPSSPRPNISTGNYVQHNSWEAAQFNNLPKLPPVKIPKFSGDYKEWKPFIEIFTTVIYSNIYLSKVEKMQYLLYHLEGDARKVISHLQLGNDNYDSALRLVQARYNNNRRIITNYINTIMDIKKVEHRCQEDIIMLYDTIRECTEALKNFNCQTQEWGPIIVCIAIRKLDPESLRLFE